MRAEKQKAWETWLGLGRFIACHTITIANPCFSTGTYYLVYIYWFEIFPCSGSAQDGDTPLSLACVKGNVVVAKALLSVGADIDSKTVGFILYCFVFSIIYNVVFSV